MLIEDKIEKLEKWVGELSADKRRLQEQVETLTRAHVEAVELAAAAHRDAASFKARAEAAEAERDRLREAAILLLSEIDAGNDAEHINGATGPLRAALQKEPQP